MKVKKLVCWWCKTQNKRVRIVFEGKRNALMCFSGKIFGEHILGQIFLTVMAFSQVEQ